MHIILNINDLKIIIKRLKNNNVRLHKNLEILRIIWLVKIINRKKTHSSLIVKIIIKKIMNRLFNVNSLNSYQKYIYKLFKKICCIKQCFKCWKFNHIIKFCKNEKWCLKYINKHHFKKYVTSMSKCQCVNYNKNHELWR